MLGLCHEILKAKNQLKDTGTPKLTADTGRVAGADDFFVFGSGSEKISAQTPTPSSEI